MSQHLIQKLNSLKDQLIKWPEELCVGKNGELLDADTSFKMIEAELRDTLNKVIALPESERGVISPVIEAFKEAMTRRQEEAEENLKVLKEKVMINQGTTKAMKAYGKAFDVKKIERESTLNEPIS